MASARLLFELGSTEQCVPVWMRNGTENLTCPFGRELAIPLAALTVPEDLNLVNFVACCYSAVPFVATVANVILICKNRRPREANWLLCTTSASLLHVVLKYGFSESRPVGSCLSSCGMPSGHSTYAVGMCFILLWDFVFARGACAPGDTKTKAVRAGLISLLLLPVTWSRYQIRDHTLGQILAGASLGLLCTALWIPYAGPFIEARMPRSWRANAHDVAEEEEEDACWKRQPDNGAELQRLPSATDNGFDPTADGGMRV